MVQRRGDYWGTPPYIDTVTLKVTDASGASTCETTITLHDLRPIVITARPEPLVLWPPNHDMVPINTTVTASDICDPNVTRTIVEVPKDFDNSTKRAEELPYYTADEAPEEDPGLK